MDSIEKLAIFFRTVLGIPEDIRPDLMDVLRRAKFMKVIKDFRPGSADELRGAAATWVRKSKAILIAPDLWDKLKDGDDADLRFTVFHELGHAALNHADRNRKFGGATQFGDKIKLDEDEADRFAMAFAIPLTFASKINILDKEGLMKQFGLSDDKTSLRMVDLRMHNSHATSLTRAEIAAVDFFDAEAWLTENVFVGSGHSKNSVPTEDEDWNF